MTPEQLDLAVHPIFAAMTARGIRVDVGKMEALRGRVMAELGAQEAALCVYAGRDLNPYSPRDVGEWLAAEKLAGTRRTRSRRSVSTDERALSMLLDVHPVPGRVLACRGLRKLLTTFIQPVLTKVVGMAEPTVHPRWRLTRVKSGRPSCEDPNLLAFPTRDAWGRQVRDCFVARPGWALVSVDFSQIEPRVAAALSGDEALRQVFAEGRDLYADMARRLFRLTEPDAAFRAEPHKTRYRLPAKIVLLGCVLYGMQAEHLHEELIRFGCGTASAPYYDMVACEDFVRRRFEPYPRLAELLRQTVLEARRESGWAKTLGGRGRFLPALLLDGRRWPASKLREEAERQAFNHLIQGTAQEIAKRAMLTVDGEGLAYPLLQIYDEMVYEVPMPMEVAALRARQLARLMASELRGVEISTSFAVADSWGELK